MGLFWCVSNLARHVTRVLKRAVESLNDAEARRVVDEAVMEHSRLLTHRRGIKGNARWSSPTAPTPLTPSTPSTPPTPSLPRPTPPQPDRRPTSTFHPRSGCGSTNGPTGLGWPLPIPYTDTGPTGPASDKHLPPKKRVRV